MDDVSFFISFFCISNVTAMLSANSKLADGVESRRPSLKNLILRRQSSFVHFISLRGTFEYLQERHAKNPAQIVSCDPYLAQILASLLILRGQRMEGPFVALLWDRRFYKL